MINHYFGSGVYAKETLIPAGHVLVQHKHKFSHLSILASGSIELMVDGERKIIHAPACLTIEADKHHGVKSLTDVVWYCIHATECTDMDVIDEVLIAPSDVDQAQQLAKCLQEN
jgi:mannose-6-phosphate isomerase-like protein (cupin superfamily)